MKKIAFLSFLFLVLMSFIGKKHPYHVGSVEVNYNEKSKTYEITAKFFMDDLENALNKEFGTALHFKDKNHQTKINELLKKYSANHFKLKSDNVMQTINFIGYEEDQENVDFYLESAPTKPPKKVEVSTSFLYNLFNDQYNIVHIVVKGNRKTDKISYPDKYLYQLF